MIRNSNRTISKRMFTVVAALLVTSQCCCCILTPVVKEANAASPSTLVETVAQAIDNLR